jgi:opacity protein-like surface antigen
MQRRPGQGARAQRRRCWTRAGALSLVVFLAGFAANAQFAMISDPPPRFEWQGRIGADYRAEFQTRSNGGDEFDAWRTGIEGDFGGPINQSILVGMGMRYAYTGYDFNLVRNAPLDFGGNRLPRDPCSSAIASPCAPPCRSDTRANPALGATASPREFRRSCAGR